MKKRVSNAAGRLAMMGVGCLSLALVVTGCATGESTPAQPGEASGVPTIAQGSLTCSMSGEYRPFNFYDEAGEIVGFDVDICEAIAAELGLEAQPTTAPFNSLIAGLQADRSDAIIGSLAITDERKEQVNFTQPYYETGASLFVQEGSSVGSIEELSSATLGVTLGTTFEEFARGLDNISDVKTFQSEADALKDLEAGRLDGVIAQGFMGNYLAKNGGFKVKEVGDTLFPDIAAIAVNKNNPELLAAIDAALNTIRESGKYDEIGIEWFGHSLG